MNQESFLLSKLELNEKERRKISRFPWLEAAFRRMAIVETLDTRGTGSLLKHSVIASGSFADAIKWWASVPHLYYHPVISHVYPSAVTSPVESQWASNDEHKICLFVPEYRPHIPEPETGKPPERNDLIIMVNAFVRVAVLKVSWIGREPYFQFAKRLSLMHIDVSSGVPSSLLYNVSGKMVGVALTSTADDKVLAIPTYEVTNFYSHCMGVLRSLKAD